MKAGTITYLCKSCGCIASAYGCTTVGAPACPECGGVMATKPEELRKRDFAAGEQAFKDGDPPNPNNDDEWNGYMFAKGRCSE